MPEKNPWLNLPFKTYKNHMSHAQVQQYQAIHDIMGVQADLARENQLQNIAVLGVTDGNGLEHFSNIAGIKNIVAVDINEEYLELCALKYGGNQDTLRTVAVDLTDLDRAAEVLRGSDMLIANMVIEHIGLDTFLKIAQRLNRLKFISVTIQQNHSTRNVSESGYERAFAEIGDDMQMVDCPELEKGLKCLSYTEVGRLDKKLPNDKSFLTLHVKKAE